jgi:hypothetical protein
MRKPDRGSTTRQRVIPFTLAWVMPGSVRRDDDVGIDGAAPSRVATTDDGGAMDRAPAASTGSTSTVWPVLGPSTCAGAG